MHVVMACAMMVSTVMAHTVMAYIVMAHTVMAYIAMAYVVLAYVVMVHTVMACIVMAYIRHYLQLRLDEANLCRQLGLPCVRACGSVCATTCVT